MPRTSTRYASSRIAKLLVLSMVLCISALILTVTVSSESPRNIRAGTTKDAIRMFDVGLGPHTFKVQMGRDTESHYLGGSPLQQALLTGQAQPRTMVGEDFNGDGMGDLIVGYANNGSGILSFRIGNNQAIAPTDHEVFAGIQQGRFPAPFLPEARLFSLPEPPDFLQTGDFNADGYKDVLAAARGGATLYLLAGDGQENLGAAQEFQLSGSLTALRVSDSRQPGVFTSLAVGLRTDEGTKALIYNQAGGGLAGEPESYSMPGDVTAFAFGRLDDDVQTDLVAATTNQVMVIHGRSDQPADPGKGALTVSAHRTPAVETESLPFVIRGLAVGDFVWDRNHQREIAVLSDDGTVYLSARGNPDTRPYTVEEIKTLRNLKRSYTYGKIDMDTFTAESNKLVRPNRDGGWKVSQTIDSGVMPAAAGSTQALFQRLDASTLPTDDLLIGNGLNNHLQMVRNDHDAAKLKIQATTKSVDLSQLSADSAPIAAVSMRMNVDSRPGSIVLKADSIEPEFVILSPDTIFTVNSPTDLADDVPTAVNGVCHTSANTCTLRAAIMQSNRNGGSNTIMVPDNTYTISLGAPDDEANTGGATEQSGDLDIFNWQPFNSVTGDTSATLTAVSITGASRDGTIISMGTFGTPLATNNPTNKERILEINDGASVQSRINVTLTNLTFQNGVEPTGSGTFLDGGAIWYDGSDVPTNTNIGLLTLHNVKLTGNTSAGSGGGVHAQFGSLKIESTSIVRANTSQHKVGGGVEYNGGNSVETQFLLIDGSTIGGAAVADGNQATDVTFGAGGGLDTRGGGTGGATNGIVISNGTIIQNNLAQSVNGVNGGGGIQLGNGPVFAFSNSTISNNSAKNMAGGLLSNAVTLGGANATITLTSMTITGNTADSENNGTGDGGGIYNFAGSLVITGTSHIDGNTAVNGGGIFNTWNGINTGANLTMTNGTIGQTGAGNGNNAKNSGGGFAINPGAPPTPGVINLNTVSIANNTANSDSSGGGDGGGIFVATANLTSLNDCTVDSNVANSGTGDGIFMSGGTITAAGTLTLSGDDSLNINGGTFTSTAGIFNLAGNFTRAAGGTFTHNSGTVNFNGAGAQNINGTATSEAFNNFTVNKGGGTLTVGGSTTSLSIASNVTLTAGTFAAGTATSISLTGNGGNWTNNGGTFTPGSSVVSFTNTAGAQAINGSAATQTFNSITMAKTAQTLSVAGSTTTLNLNGTMLLTSGSFSAGTAANINVGGDWTNNGATFTPGTGTVTFNGGGAQNLNGTAATQTFNNFTVSKGGGTLTGGGSTNTLTIGGNFSITAGAFATGATLTTINDAGNWGNAGTFTPGASNTVIFNGNNSTQTLTGSTSFTNLTSNHTGTGGVTASGSTLAVTGLMRVQAGIFTSSSTFNNVQIDSGTTLVSDGGTMNVSGNWTNNSGTFTPSTGTVNFNGAGAQTLGGTAATQSFNNFTVNKGGGTLTVGGSTTTLNVGSGVTLTAGTFAAGTAATFNVTGNWTNNGGTFTPGTGTVIFNGAAGQTIGGTTATTFNNFTNSDAGGIAMNNNNTVAGVLALGTTDITVANTMTLSQTSATASTGTGDVIGSIKRTATGALGTAYTFGNPNNRITTTAGTAPTDITVNLAKTAPVGFTGAVSRTYTITPTGGSGITATLRLHYLDAELNGNPEASLLLRRFNGIGWAPYSATASDTTNNWVENNVVHNFSPWTLSGCCSPTGSNGAISGRITTPDGRPVEGAVVNLGGDQSRKTITDANGNYRFEDVGTGGFYTVTPSRANLSFAPSNRSFSQSGNQTEAAFTGNLGSDSANPLDTAEYFVRQQYVDVLGREPDEAGFNYWSDKILACGLDIECVRRQRREVAAAFFISDEDQASGSFIYDVYAGSLGRRPAFGEFSVDRTQVVGGAALDTEKTTFVRNFVQRAEFATKYQHATTAEVFVDALIQSVQSSGVNLSGERPNLITSYNLGTDLVTSRATVVRAVADHAVFKQSQYNQAFVLTEYFAYLRRDIDQGGYDFWVGVLNTGDMGNYRGMVCSFVTSREYQNRFSQIVSHSNRECGN